MSADQRMLGDPDQKEALARMIRVDQAGEYGAVRIYQGQRAVLRNNKVLKQMESQEREHLARFNALVVEHKVRPTLLQPLWHLAGFALGAGTALLGEKAAMACTVAVEDVIEEHYARQEQALGDSQPELLATVQQFRADEVQHKNHAIEQGAEQAAGYPLLYAAISRGTKLAIWLSERL